MKASRNKLVRAYNQPPLSEKTSAFRLRADALNCSGKLTLMKLFLMIVLCLIVYIIILFLILSLFNLNINKNVNQERRQRMEEKDILNQTCKPCAYLHNEGPLPLCLSLERSYYHASGQSLFPEAHECGKGRCIHYKESQLLLRHNGKRYMESLIG
jgi:hypothetical protein